MTNKTGRTVNIARGGGKWFPGGKKELDLMTGAFMDKADVPQIKGRIIAGIAPHAGYIYSGRVAGYTFRAIRDQAVKGIVPETVVVLGFSHRAGFPGVAVMAGDAVQTPLGETDIDTEGAAVLTTAGRKIMLDSRLHAGEHSAENEIPFIQKVLPGAKVIIALIGDHDAETIDELVKALGVLAGRKKIIVIASTDLLHDADYDLVTKTDKDTLAQIGRLEIKSLSDRWSYDSQVCCGIAPVIAVMKFAAAQGCREGRVLFYRNSGDDHPDSRGSWVVGYGSVVFAAEDGEQPSVSR